MTYVDRKLVRVVERADVSAVCEQELHDARMIAPRRHVTETETPRDSTQQEVEEEALATDSGRSPFSFASSI